VPLLPLRRLFLIPIRTHQRPRLEYQRRRAISDCAGVHASRHGKWRTNDIFGSAVATAVCSILVDPREGLAFVYLMVALVSVHVVSDLILCLPSRVSSVLDAFDRAKGTMGNVSSEMINVAYIHDVYLISLVVVWRYNSVAGLYRCRINKT
jgi:hypothetical protein